jgi:mannose-1-phosphate guanylyltransferase
MSGNVWGLILAAGEGSRLRTLTMTSSGIAVPKQFCSLQGGQSLLEEAIGRAEAVTHRARILTVVAEQHRRWWEAALWSMARDNVIVQPENRGTAAGLLLPLLHIAQRDPDAVVVVLPADHFVEKEAILARSLKHAVRLASIDRKHVHLLGLEPEEADPELGYILPETGGVLTAAPVRQFVEKPSTEIARGLIGSGALWNVFILAASVRSLLALYARRHSELLRMLAVAAMNDARNPRLPRHARDIYPGLTAADFSRDVLEGEEAQLRVLTVPKCGWSDLGTPSRVAATLERLNSKGRATPRPSNNYVNLAAQQQRLQYAT